MSVTLLGMLNTPEIIALLVLALILFGAKKLPELARGLGHGIKEFKKATRDVTDELHSAMDVDAGPTPTPPSSAVPQETSPYEDPELTESSESSADPSTESAEPAKKSEAVAQTTSTDGAESAAKNG